MASDPVVYCFSRYHEALACKKVLCPLVFTVVGATLFIGGIIMTAVGFGSTPRDVNDLVTMWIRCGGLIMLGAGVLPILLSSLFWWFFSLQKKGEPLPGRAAITQESILMRSTSSSTYSRPTGSSHTHHQPPSVTLQSDVADQQRKDVAARRQQWVDNSFDDDRSFAAAPDGDFAPQLLESEIQQIRKTNDSGETVPGKTKGKKKTKEDKNSSTT